MKKSLLSILAFLMLNASLLSTTASFAQTSRGALTINSMTQPYGKSEKAACFGWGPFCPPGWVRACGPWRCWCRPC
jgi:hypothetical protein